MSHELWQFWIDVGGTFTDCFARAPDGQLRRHKLLSSGITKGIASAGSTNGQIVDPSRRNAPDGFFNGYTLRLLDADGCPSQATLVVVHDARRGRLVLDPPLPTPVADGMPYELVPDEDAPVVAIRYLLGLKRQDPLPPLSLRLGTTRGTNALLTRQGARTALVTTRGFGDVLLIGYQNRPHLFELTIRKRDPLFDEIVEVDERVGADGEILRAPDPVELRRQLRRLREQGTESLAICLMNAYCRPDHEQLVEAIARDVGFTEISRSSRIAPMIKIVSRGDTTVLDAYLNPILRRYVQRLRQALQNASLDQTVSRSPTDGSRYGDLRILTSAGGLTEADHFTGKDSILSGPAGGVVGFSRVAQAAGWNQAIGLDMGGTSTDVSRFDGRWELEYETEKAGVRIVAPTMAIETVAAGGGSICRFDGVKLVVGPESAGADPGPACYGRGGPLTITDVNLLLGRILPSHFPFPLDAEASRRRCREILDELPPAQRDRYDLWELADGFLQIANARMAKAIRSISVARGYDPRDYLLVAFGGAAPQHACAIARELQMTHILNHPDASLLSALGVGMADTVRHRAVGLYRRWEAGSAEIIARVFDDLAQQAVRDVEEEGIDRARIETKRFLDLRYEGTDAWLTIEQPPDGDFAKHFVQEHQRRYGYVHHSKPLEIVAARVEATGRSQQWLPSSARVAPGPAPRPAFSTRTCFDGTQVETAVYQRESLCPGTSVSGPALILETNSTTVVEPDWRAEVLSQGELLLTRRGSAGENAPAKTTIRRDERAADPVLLEIFNNHFAGIAEQMGWTLRNTSTSVNVKERLDFSCALFTAQGHLVVNAPHIPVHLGAMGETVQRVIRDVPDLNPGDVIVTNDPYRGGSHLPDITVITPVHDPRGGQLRFFVANRAHHAEIGGVVPGSMPPFSRSLAEEGVVIRHFKLVEQGVDRSDQLRALLLQSPYPTRNVKDNLADLSAQVAANQQGVRDCLELIDRYTWTVVERYMKSIQRAAEAKMRRALRRLPDGRRTFRDHLDDGSPIVITITIDGDEATLDFTGTGPVLPGNLNANPAIVTAAVMYCLRCLIDEDIPLNHGVLTPVRLILPPCLLNPPAHDDPVLCPAVAGGNVETSQRVVDVILGALEVAAASQGTMNNVLFGNERFGYYETICGGAGATPSGPGADAVHTHMTNTRLTDPEILEQRYPVRLRRFAIRRGSGGDGRHRGGDGVIRELEFLEPLQVALLTQRRGDYLPYGLAGGAPGKAGRHRLVRTDGTVAELAGIAQFDARAGDVLTVETPGGGGYFGPKTQPFT